MKFPLTGHWLIFPRKDDALDCAERLRESYPWLATTVTGCIVRTEVPRRLTKRFAPKD